MPLDDVSPLPDLSHDQPHGPLFKIFFSMAFSTALALLAYASFESMLPSLGLVSSWFIAIFGSILLGVGLLALNKPAVGTTAAALIAVTMVTCLQTSAFISIRKICDFAGTTCATADYVQRCGLIIFDIVDEDKDGFLTENELSRWNSYQLNRILTIRHARLDELCDVGDFKYLMEQFYEIGHPFKFESENDIKSANEVFGGKPRHPDKPEVRLTYGISETDLLFYAKRIKNKYEGWKWEDSIFDKLCHPPERGHYVPGGLVN